MTMTINRVRSVRDAIVAAITLRNSSAASFVGDHTTHRVFPNQILVGCDGREYVVTIVETQKPRLPRV